MNSCIDAPRLKVIGHHRFQVEAQRHKLSSSRNVFAEDLQDQVNDVGEVNFI